MTRATLVVSVLLVVLLLVACAPAAPAPALQTSPATTPPVKAAPQSPSTAPAALAPPKPAWETKWEETLAAAKHEGNTVVVRVVGGHEERNAMTRIAKLEGMSAEIIAASGSQFFVKLLAERRAGLNLVDLTVAGYTTTLTVAKPAGILERIDSAFILPDLTDTERIKKVWYRGELPWVDKEHTVFHMSLQPQSPIVANSNLVKEGDLKSYRDLLNPKWQGKFLLSDPTVGGAGQQAATATALIMGWDFIEELVKSNPIVMRDMRLMLEWLAQGKVAVIHGQRSEALPEFFKIGAPIREVTPVEGTRMTAGSSGVSLFTRAPHPNATKVFLNAMLTREGQDIYAPALGHQSVRLDASSAHLRPDEQRQQGGKYVDTYTEESQTRTADAEKRLRTIFAPLIK